MDPLSNIPQQFQPFLAAPLVLGIVGAVKATRKVPDEYMPALCLAVGTVLGVVVGLDAHGDLILFGLDGLVTGLAAESLFGGTANAVKSFRR
jgi:hypothetical protein